MTRNGIDLPTGSPFISPETPMLSQVLVRLDAIEDIAPGRLRDLKSAIRTLARLIGRPLETTPANINWLHIRLRRVQRASFDMSKKRFSNVKSDAMKALKITGCSRKRSDWLQTPSPTWKTLLDQIADKHDQWKLTQFAQYCTALEVDPDGVTDEHPGGLLKALVEESFVNRPEHVAANAIKTWNRLKGQVPGWPDIEFAPLPPRKVPWTFAIESFPASFQADVVAWLERLRNPNLLDASGPARPLRPTTITHRRFQIREAASALVRSGKPVEEITDLAVLVDLDNLKAALRWMMHRFEDKPTEAIQGVAVCLQAIARHHVCVDDAHLDEIRGIVKRLNQGVDGLREKNRQRLLQLDDTHNLLKLLHLPATLVANAKRLKAQSPRKAALLLQVALAIEILLNAPMRVGNLTALHLERHLRRLRVERERRTHIHIPAQEVKNNVDLDYELGPDATKLLDLYLIDGRPALIKEPSDYLFPATNGGPKAPTGLSRLIKSTILEHTGLEIHAHLFRSIAGKIHSLVHPGDVITLSYVLNNSLKTAMKDYAQFERRSALNHYQRSVEKARQGIRR